MTLEYDAGPLSFEYRSFSLDLTRPLETAHGTIESRDGFVVRVGAEGGDGAGEKDGADGDDLVGYGEATPLPGFTESYADCEAALERASAAMETEGPQAALKVVDRTAAARHAVSLALADRRAKRAASPLYRHLGEPSMVGRVPVNATIGGGSPADAVEAVREAVERGFTCCKLKAGLETVETDVGRVRRVREAVGPSVELRVDANGAWTYDEAAAAIDAFADLGVSLVEQPLPAGALEGHAALRGRGVAIGIDEGLLQHGIDAVAEADAADVLVLKPMALGGVDVAREVAAWAIELEIVPLVTTTIDAVVARTGAVHLAASIPDVPASGLATGELLAADLAKDPVLFEKGAAVVPQAKGLGVEGVWNE
ncbi:mandelate racemase/muconate lactonizing enzyme family protein [Natrialbaceae archaeon GCM10025810]|uniref:mandelate racemase/muconate lactonizing enzyme family protein n=1 Tax=Halovalidus salilacus TaxID=3075124 RepID=UPI003606A0A6